MFDLDKLRAVGAMVARQAREKAAADPEAANDIIDMSPLLAPWRAGTADKPVEHPFAEVVTHGGLPWYCISPHTHRGEPDWEPDGGNALWAVYHGRDAAHALPYKAEGHNPYDTGHWMIWTNGLRYRSNMDGNVFTPESYPISWDGPFDADGNLITEASV